MRYTGFGLGLFSIASLVSISLWFANNPDFLMGHPTIASVPSKGAPINDEIFIKQIKGSLRDVVSRPPEVDRTRPVNVSWSGGRNVDNWSLHLEATHADGYGVKEDFLKTACREISDCSQSWSTLDRIVP
jgi:hypothetical protein